MNPSAGHDATGSSWPIRCPVDSRWLSDNETTCPECDSPVAALRALNELAAHLLEQAAASLNPDAAATLVADAAALVPSTEIFEVAAADALERGGRPDLAAARLAAALAIAPLRADLNERLESLRTKAKASRPTKAAARLPSLQLGIAGLVVLLLGAFIGAALGPRDPGELALASREPSTTSTRPPSTAGTPTGTPPGASAAPSPTPPTASAPPAASALVRAAIDADPVLASLVISVEEIGDEVRISGAVPNVATVRTIEIVAASAAPHTSIDLAGLMVPEQRYFFVQRGDTLWTIAARIYQDPRKWRDIAAANPELDPSALSVGERIKLPD